MAKKFKWTVQFEIDESWVADGFELTNKRALDMLAHDLGYAYENEIGAKVIKAPKPEAIRKVKGITA